MKRTLSIIIIALLLSSFAGTCFAAADNSPMVRLRSGIQGVIEILNDPQYKGNPEMRENQILKIRETIKDFFNFEELSKRSVGRPWLQFTPEEQERFVGLFTDLLEQTYLARIEDYSGEKVAFDKETIIKGKYAQVDTRLLTGKQDIPVFYRMKLKDGEWDVYDVKIEGVSLVKNYRTQFSGILDTTNDKTFAASKKDLFDRLEKKCEELKFNPKAAAENGKK
ncbi:ABC transporter substrate-binding protein [Desulfovibrio sp. JC010]|uniref:Tgt2/MlaC family protein n=1 Tax=Desulfovibrio sp. JC010 TaxID=2593641 RepID=UPI0013D7BE8D|nr:ABC transporter substrate-binding protein [Desulfovibrio sp. JC010]NDV25865.1 ABC transporter substrate-binding protein [Desulfovibrio sp. JC010]